MMGMRGSNWIGFLMLAVLLIVHEPIWLFLSSETTNILWVIPVAAYVIVAAVLLIRAAPNRGEA